MLTEVSSSVFTNSESVTLLPVVSAEWNHNLFNAPYITTAGNGLKIFGTPTGTISNVTIGAKENFITKSFQMSDGTGSVIYTASLLSGKAYKVITYAKTNSPVPVMITTSGKGTTLQYGSQQAEISSLGWTKIITNVGCAKESDSFSSLVYKIVANSLSGDDNDATVFFTEPEFYETTLFDYKYEALFPTESPFTYFRPGESYVSTGDVRFGFPTGYRKINSTVLKNYVVPTYSPISSIVQNPQFFLSSPPVPVLKTALPNDIAAYKYFVSDSSSKNISAIYEAPILTNKIVIKVNAIMTTPKVNVYLNGSLITVDGATEITFPTTSDNQTTGLLVLYWTGSAWTKTRWSDMPSFNLQGELSKTTTITSIRVAQSSKTINSQFALYTGTDVSEDLNRFHVIEISPRLEVDLSNFVQDVSISKSLDASNTALPLSSINSNDARISLSGIPAIKNNLPVPMFSSQSNNALTVLSGLLRKNIKFYVSFNLKSSSSISGGTAASNTYIPGGVFYSDSWSEYDINNATIQAYDISRYLQSRPVSDYVVNLKTVFEIITNILDLSGFTDYDYDSLYNICNNKSYPLDIAYYYCNSKDLTVLGALNEIFVAYQIGAHIDEYGIMRFISLYDILTSTANTLNITDAQVTQGGLSVANNAKPGKISLRYQTPKVKQSPSLQNVTDPTIKNSAAFIYTTSNDVVWQQQTIDSVGFNYLDNDMLEDSNTMNINVNDLLDVFHTFNMDNNGFAAIEKEIVSFEYKEYTISTASGNNPKTVSIKNNLELASEINKFIKENTIGLTVSDGTTKPESAYDIKITPTGNITNVQRGMFGTVPVDHKRFTNLVSKGLREKSISSNLNFSSTSGNTSINNNLDNDTSLPNVTKIGVFAADGTKTAICAEEETNIKYKTYSVKFDIPDQYVVAAGLFINESSTDSIVPVFVELIKYSTAVPSTGFFYEPPKYKYILAIYDGNQVVHAWSDVTGECSSIINGSSKIIKKDLVDSQYEYAYVTDQFFNLKVVLSESNGSDGENANTNNVKTIFTVSLNNVEITGWQVPGTTYNASTSLYDDVWTAPNANPATGARQKPVVPDTFAESKSFGFYTSNTPIAIPRTEYNTGSEYPEPAFRLFHANLREIHATEKELLERSVSYFYQDREFLNGLVQGQPLSSNSLTYLMQTTPEIAGINYYDVQYTTPAAVSVDILPIEYMWYYFAGSEKEDQTRYQKKLIDEYSLAYSTPINTGFRAKMAIANNSSNMVFLHKEADDINQFSINFNLWTHEIVAPSDPELIEFITDSSNMSEVVQLDSEWIQSKAAANRMLKLVETGLEGFSKEVSVEIFGNPLIQIGDVINLTYSLNGISQQRYLVSSVSHEFNQGLVTNLKMNRIYQ